MKYLHKVMGLLLVLCLLCCATALGEGILPALQTPLPEITEAFSFHCFRGTEEPAFSSTESGETVFAYENVTYALYQDFGKALGQKGYVLVTEETEADGAAVATVQQGEHLPLRVRYHQETRQLTVTYPMRTSAQKADADNPFHLETSRSSILPELKQVISLPGATGVDWVMPEAAEGTGYVYRYQDVGYACYTAFSVKLGEEGFTLVSSETLEDGTARAVVTDGEINLTLDYNMTDRVAALTYPVGAHARDIREEDSTQVKEEQSFALLDGVTVTFTGWNYVKTVLKENSSSYTSMPVEEGCRLLMVTADIQYNNPAPVVRRDILKRLAVHYGEETLEDLHGSYHENNNTLESLSINKAVVQGVENFTFAVVVQVTEEQAQHPDQITLTFTDPDQAARYIYALEGQDLQLADRNRARWAIAMTGAIITESMEQQASASGRVYEWMKSFEKIDLLHPDKVAVIQLKLSQAEAAMEALGVEKGKTTEIAIALGKKINLLFDEGYAEAAELVSVKTTHDRLSDLSGQCLVALPYGEHIVLACFRGNAVCASLIISSKDISAALGEADILQYTEQLGLSGVKIRIYEGEQADSLIQLRNTEGNNDGWYSGHSAAEFLMEKATGSQESFLFLTPKLTNLYFTSQLLSNYLVKQESVSPLVLRHISDMLYNGATGDEEPVETMLRANNTYPSSAAATAVSLPQWGETLTEEDLPATGTYTFVVTRHQGEETSVYDWPLQAALPAACIPEKPEEAEYIIHIDITYADEADVSNGAVSLFYPNGHITVHRASDGALLRDCGTVTRKLYGMTMLPWGNNYWDPYRADTWDMVRSIFEQ